MTVPEKSAPIRGVIFDLDGTLVDSRLDFDQMRTDMDLPAGEPILESLAKVPASPEKDRKLEILHEHEQHGSESATLMPGVAEILDWLTSHDLPLAILTRNSKICAELVVRLHSLPCAPVLTRDDAPPKPDPTGLLKICESWSMPTTDVVYVGDYLFDLQAGTSAGMRSLLYAPDEVPEYANQATWVIRHFTEIRSLWASQITAGR